MPKNLTEALALAAERRNPQAKTAPKQMAKEFVGRKQELDFKTTAYHAAPRTEMY